MIKTILVVGEISAGKSSFINALAGGFVSCVSLLRETFQATKYSFRKSTSHDHLYKRACELEKEHQNNLELRNKDTNISNQLQTISLPCPPQFNDIDIIDFPGLKDSGDSQDKFMELIKNYITIADTIFFVTDANSAFTKGSEVTTFNKIKKLIDDELKINLHHIDLLIIVNKYDEDPFNTSDDDVNSIYLSISNKLHLKENEPIYRISSHKLVCHLLSSNKSSLPKFMMTEIKKIFKNGDVSQKSMNLLNRKKGDKLDIIVTKPKEIELNNNTSGDWDHLLTYIQDIKTTQSINYSEIYINEMKSIKDTIIHLHNSKKISSDFELYKYSSSTYGSNYEKQQQSLKEITTWIDRIKLILSKEKHYDISLQNIVDDIILEITEELSLILKDQSNRPLIIEILFELASKDIKGELAVVICKNWDKLCMDSKLIFLNLFLENDLEVSLIWDLLKNPGIFSIDISFSQDNIYRYYDNKIQCKKINKIEGKYVYKSWVINNLLNSDVTTSRLKYMIYLSTLNSDVIKLLFQSNMIQNDILTIDVSNKLYFYCHSLTSAKTLEQSLFNLDKIESVNNNYESFLEAVQFTSDIIELRKSYI